MMKIAIIDYEVGNIRSIYSALGKVGAEPKLTRDRQEILAADGVVLPGVGAYSHGMEKLKEHSLDCILKKFSAMGKPVLGICLGMQLLFSESNEFGYTEGLGLVPGSVKELQLLNPEVQNLPHISWSELELPSEGAWDGTILEGIAPQEDMYFIHSFMAAPDNNDHVLSLTTYSDCQFCSLVRNENVYGCQFHPEKSAEEGLKIIANFIRICEVDTNG
jgi:imidazole glycerol-phosphate synthase subunit HisH